MFTQFSMQQASSIRTVTKKLDFFSEIFEICTARRDYNHELIQFIIQASPNEFIHYMAKMRCETTQATEFQLNTKFKGNINAFKGDLIRRIHHDKSIYEDYITTLRKEVFSPREIDLFYLGLQRELCNQRHDSEVAMQIAHQWALLYKEKKTALVNIDKESFLLGEVRYLEEMERLLKGALSSNMKAILKGSRFEFVEQVRFTLRPPIPGEKLKDVIKRVGNSLVKMLELRASLGNTFDLTFIQEAEDGLYQFLDKAGLFTQKPFSSEYPEVFIYHYDCYELYLEGEEHLRAAIPILEKLEELQRECQRVEMEKALKGVVNEDYQELKSKVTARTPPMKIFF